jgi:hypothetical protein
MWVLLSVLGLLVEMTVIVVLGRRTTADYEGLPLVGPTTSGAPAAEQPAAPDPSPVRGRAVRSRAP